MPPRAWAATVVGLGVLDYWASRQHTGTLSEAGRHYFRVEHPVGRTVFTAAWVGLSMWIVPHICDAAKRASS